MRHVASCRSEIISGKATDRGEIEADELDPSRVCSEVDALLPADCGFATGLSGHFWSFTALHMTRRRTATNMDPVRSFVGDFLNGTGPYVLDARIQPAVMSRTFRRANL